MNTTKAVNEYYEEAFISAGLGIWIGNFTKRTYSLSNYEIVGLDTGILSFDDFLNMVREDYRELVASDALSFLTTGIYERAYPVITPKGEKWIQAKAFKKSTNEDGDTLIIGQFRLMENSKEIREEEVKSSFLNVIHKQNNIASTFISFLKESNVENNVQVVLKEILSYYNANRCYIVEYDFRRGVHNCIYEVESSGVDLLKDKYSDIPTDPLSWWNRKIFLGTPIIIHDTDELSDSALYEKNLLTTYDVKSVMAIPLPSKDGIWGYLGLDITDKKRKWSNMDYQWLSATANMLSVCLELHRYENKTRQALSVQRSRDLLLMNVFSNSPIGIELFDDNGLLVTINKTSAEIYGVVNKNDVIGLHLFEDPILPDNVKEKLHNHEEVTFKTEYDISKVSRFYSSSLTHTKELIIRISPINDETGKFAYYLMVTFDNSELSNMASKMRDFESIFSVVSNYVKIGYYKLNINKRESYATKQWLLNWGEEENTSVDDVLGHYSKVNKEDRTKLLEFIDRIKKGNRDIVFNDDIRVENGNGGWNWIHVTTLFSNHDEGDKELISVTTDITKEKESEMMLIEAKNKAETMDRLKSAFLANMSHEIRTPLNAIIGFSGLLTSPEFVCAEEDEKKYYGSIIKENSDLLLQLISDILDLSKIEAGTLDFFYDKVDINSLCKDLYNVQKTKTKENVLLKIDLPEEKCVMRSDKNRLMQVLINFLTNAIKFTSHGTITLGYKIIGNEIEFYVQDTGMGISESNAKLVFDSFVKLNNSIKGTGLGLAICKSIIEQMDGTIGVSTNLGEGSRFWFRLPYSSESLDAGIAETPASDSPDYPDTPTRSKKAIILVGEDNEGSYILVSTALKKKYDILWAQNGAIAVGMYKEKKPDLIIMDTRMPEMDGLEATRAIRAIDKNIPIISLTAYAFSSDREEAIKAGCNEFLTKPVSPIVLKETINKLLKQR